MRARRVGIAGNGEPPEDRVVALGDEDGNVSGARREPEVAALGERSASFRRRSTSPRARNRRLLPGRRVCAHRPAAPCERRRSYDNQAGAAAARVARRLERPIVADAHGRHRRRRGCALRRASERRGSPAARARPTPRTGYPSAVRSSPSRCDRGRSIAGRSSRPWSTRSRWSGRSLLSGAPTRRCHDKPRRPCESSTLGAIMLVRRRPGTAAFTDAGLRSTLRACCSAGFRSPERRHPSRSRWTMKGKRRSRVCRRR